MKRGVPFFGCVIFCLSAVPMLKAASTKEVEKLDRECQAGKTESCQKIAEIAKTKKGFYEREAAVERLADKDLLAEIAKNDKHPLVRVAAAMRHGDRTLTQAVLAEIIKTEQSVDMRKAVVGRIIDQALLAQVATDDSDETVRNAAIEKLTDQALLTEIAKSEKSAKMREAVVGRITDQALLADLLKTTDHEDVRMMVIVRLVDPALVSRLAIDEANEKVRKAAENRVRQLADPLGFFVGGWKYGFMDALSGGFTLGSSFCTVKALEAGGMGFAHQWSSYGQRDEFSLRRDPQQAGRYLLSVASARFTLQDLPLDLDPVTGFSGKGNANAGGEDTNVVVAIKFTPEGGHSWKLEFMRVEPSGKKVALAIGLLSLGFAREE